MKKTTRTLAKNAMIELAEQARIAQALKFPGKDGKPGEFIQRLGPVKRQVLKELKSDDIANIRWPL